MLFTDTLGKPALELLKALQNKPYLKGFYLVGGSALALYLGHRRSIDLDLFSIADFDTENLLENLQQDFNYRIYLSAANTLKGSINQINVDIIAHRYPLVGDPLFSDGIAIISMKDIVAMKLNAIATSGQRSKDFVDVFYSFGNFGLKEMLEFYKIKYHQEDDTHILKSLIYFNDVDLSDWPVLIKDSGLKWKDITSKLESEVLKYIHKFKQ
jgi:hypothetical protein